jgi:hypothetical protein
MSIKETTRSGPKPRLAHPVVNHLKNAYESSRFGSILAHKSATSADNGLIISRDQALAARIEIKQHPKANPEAIAEVRRIVRDIHHQ